MTRATLAFDRASVRSIDADGRLHISTNNISKASVDPYYGHEIPDSAALGLDPTRIYHMLRDPNELAAGAATFNNLPILSEHVPVDADDHQPAIVIGSTGTDAVFAAPYLQNSAVVWAGSEIELIEAETKRQWSCAYRYTPDMTSGVFRGLRYDGIMRNIIGNHVALVHEGRAGPDVVVADSYPEVPIMLKSRRALMLSGALTALVMPKLAKGAKLDFAGALDGITAANMGARKTKLADAITALAKPKLAADEGLDVADVVEIIEAVQGIEGAPDDDVIEEKVVEDDDGDTTDETLARVLSFLEGKLSDDDAAALAVLIDGTAPAMDDQPAGPKVETVSKKAMDAALAKTRLDTMREMGAMRDAEREVAPHIGEIRVTMDSAAAIYKLALDNAKVDLTGVHPSAYRAMVRLLPSPGTKPIAQDSATLATHRSDFDKRFPNAIKPRSI